MASIWMWTMGSVILVSLISLVGLFTLGISRKTLSRVLTYLVAIAAGTLFGDALLHLLPHHAEEFGFSTLSGGLVLGGIVLMLVIERLIHWHHCHDAHTCEDPHSHTDHSDHVHAFGWMVLIGDGLHNFLDGAIIAASFLVDIQVGIATTIAVVLHEIPQEIADYGVLVHAGFTRAKALLVNFASALTAILGAALVLLAQRNVEALDLYLVPLTAGAFIYIAGTDLLPELRHGQSRKEILLHLFAVLVGVGFMAAILIFE